MFKAPIAGLVFTLEVLMVDLSMASLMPGAKAKRRIRLDALVPKETLARHKDELRHRQELKRSLIAEACRYLEQAKLLHDELEACYRPKVDFASLDEFCAEEAERLFA